MSVSLATERISAMKRSDLADLNAFVVVANQLSFRVASTQLGVTASALSHSMR
jgi:DNA-binding transcriptional LysR family regulator